MQCIQSISLKNELDTLDCFEKYFKIWNFLSMILKITLNILLNILKFRGKFWILGQLYNTKLYITLLLLYYD